MMDGQATAKRARTIHAIFFAVAVAYPFLAETLRQKSSANIPGRSMLIGLGACALIDTLLGSYFHSKYVSESLERLRTQPDDHAALKKWSSGCILGGVFCTSIVLLGLTLRVLGYSVAQCLPFYAVGIVLMLVWWPRLDL